MSYKPTDRLPHCWTRPVPDCQLTFFPQETEEALAELRVTKNDVRKWRCRGWISFDVDAMGQLDRPHQREVEFIRYIALSGLAEFQITELLEGLPKPYSFNPKYVAFHFEYGWVVPVQEDPFDVVEQNVTDWIEQLGAEGDLERLEGLRALIQMEIAGMGEAQEE